MYSLSSITLVASSVSSNSGTIKASAPFSGVLRLVLLAQPSHKALLDQHYQVYPTSQELDYSFTDTTGTLIFNWATVGDGSQLLMLTWPHHRATLQSPNFPATTSLAYLTTKASFSHTPFSAYSGLIIPPGLDVPRDWQSVAHALSTQLNILEPAPLA